MDTAQDLSISRSRLHSLIGRADAPLVLDVRRPPRFNDSDQLVAGARHCAPDDVEAFARSQAPREAVVYCVHGHDVGRDAALALRRAGWTAHFLAGGLEGGEDGVDAAGDIAQWRAQPLPTIRKRPDLGVTGERPSRWITRARPKIDRIACPWLVLRFIDPQAEFFYVATERVLDEARRLDAVPYDIPGAPISHAWERCSFDALLQAFGLQDPALEALALIVRGADTDRLRLAPEAAGLLAVSLGLSALHADDDHAMLRAALPVYDALYAWCATARGETHQWLAHEATEAGA
ncbi:chromate resistance protein ChrB domain-containing protein [Ramlibacter sp.]|uniref:chromate resistance protein ChrB domain-containing protein n=1 Tax=Ramlibacter sp. TaxID=1917967 RepID=UPI00185B9029|nr:chromate resistance protein ChrB domain-containing protein [Ramlibacter sp.]MBA2674550.1 chromate resistance protein [Ramlibacter sp.]